jgi:hypothetical protein
VAEHLPSKCQKIKIKIKNKQLRAYVLSYVFDSHKYSINSDLSSMVVEEKFIHRLMEQNRTPRNRPTHLQSTKALKT